MGRVAGLAGCADFGGGSDGGGDGGGGGRGRGGRVGVVGGGGGGGGSVPVRGDAGVSSGDRGAVAGLAPGWLSGW